MSTQKKSTGEPDDAVRVASSGVVRDASDLSNVKQLIDDVIRQASLLVARLATIGGARIPLAHLPDLLFHNVSLELDEQGLSRKVIADMLGLALRSFQYKVKRLDSVSIERESSLWESVLDFVADRSTVSRAELFSHFASNDERILRSVLRDLVDSAALRVSGGGQDTRYAIQTGSQTAPTAAQPSTSLDVDELPSGLDDHIRACAETLLQALDKKRNHVAGSNGVGYSTHTFEIWPGHPSEGRVRELFDDLRRALSCLGLDVREVSAHNENDDDEAVRVTFYMGQCVNRAKIGTGPP